MNPADDSLDRRDPAGRTSLARRAGTFVDRVRTSRVLTLAGPARKVVIATVSCGLAVLAYNAVTSGAGGGGGGGGGGESGGSAQVEHGRYLATIGACGACHTPARVPAKPPGQDDAAQIEVEREFRNDPDWRQYLDDDKELGGGVPFIVRFTKDLHGTVYARNITPDSKTGLGGWSVDDITKVLRTGVRKDGSVLLLFPPHTFLQPPLRGGRDGPRLVPQVREARAERSPRSDPAVPGATRDRRVDGEDSAEGRDD
jgi:hypothetical protein